MTASAPVLAEVSVLMLTYRHGDFVREALSSLLHQTALPEEIVVSDDHSPDHTWAELQAIAQAYTGPIRLVLRRNDRRRGGAANRLAAWQASRGRLVVFAHGDDISHPNRIERLHTTWRATGATSLSSDAYHYWEGTRTERNVAERCGDRAIGLQEMCEMAFMPHLLGATLAFDRAVCERFPEVIPGTRLGPAPGDMVLPFRGCLLDGHWYLDEPLIDWRRHPNQATATFFDLEAESPDARREPLEAFLIFGLLQRMRDLQHYRQGPHDPARAQLAQQLTLRTWLKRMSLWDGVRHHLETAGWTQTWT